MQEGKFTRKKWRYSYSISLVALFVFAAGCAGTSLLTNSSIPGDINLGARKYDVMRMLKYDDTSKDTIRAGGELSGIPGMWDVCFSDKHVVQWAVFEADYKFSDSLEAALVKFYGESPGFRKSPKWSYFGNMREWETDKYIVTFTGSRYPDSPTEYMKNTKPEGYLFNDSVLNLYYEQLRNKEKTE